MSTRLRAPLQPVSGTCRWVRRPAEGDLSAVLAINGTHYAIEPVFVAGVLASITLEKPNGTVYTLDVLPDGDMMCDCPDAEFRSERPGGCKHTRSIRAALNAIHDD